MDQPRRNLWNKAHCHTFQWQFYSMRQSENEETLAFERTSSRKSSYRITLMDDDEDDFFAYQAARSLSNKRIQMKQFLQAPIETRRMSSSSPSDTENNEDSMSRHKSTVVPANVSTDVKKIVASAVPTKDLIKNEIEALVTSCFTSTQRETKRKVKLGKRTAADDQDWEEEDEYVSQLTNQNRHGQPSRALLRSLNRSHLQEDEEKVTRETAAYDRLEAVLRVTKPLCERQSQSKDDDDDDDDQKQHMIQADITDTTINELNAEKPVSFDVIALKIDHSDGRQLTLSLPSSSTLKTLYYQVSESLSIPSVCLVYNNQTLRLDDDSQSKTLKQLNFSSDQIELLESYPVTRKLRIFIQTSTSSIGRRSSLSSKREYSMVETDRFEPILNTYKRDMKSSHIRFEFDGETIHPQAKPTDYEMVDGDILDAFILATSTHLSEEQTARPKVKPKTRELLFDDDSDN